MSRNPFGSRLLGAADQSARALRIRVQVLLTALLVTTNLVGAALVVVISYFVVPAPAPNGRTVVALAISIPVYVALAVVIGAAVGTTTTLRALRWATDDTAPDDEDRRKALRVPLRLTQLQALMWVTATVLFTLLAVVLQPARALSTGLTVGIAGLIACGVAYLLTEFTLRPLSARALAGESFTRRPRGAGVGDRMVIFWCLGTGAPVVGLTVAAIVALTDESTTRTRLAVICLVVAGVVLTFGLFMTVLNARSVVAPILSVRDALLDVERGDFDREVPVYDGTELGLLQSGFNQMVHGLREREHIRDLFGRHVGREVADAAALGDIELGGETRVVSVVFVDLVGSTSYSTEHSPTEVVAVLNRFFEVVVDEVDRHRGLVNKFMGDAVLAVFGAPVDLPDHARAALSAARSMAARLAAEVPEIGAGIGVATGEVVAGYVGHHERFEYTVVGDAVNCAARLTDLAKEVDGRLLATWQSVEAAAGEEGDRWTRHGSTTLRGRSEETVLAVPATVS
ncbi:adenylate cyclase [Nocardioides szechwanensis]|uniref:Adenylate cyclase n=1 Tax=Nocardioides szechwanensis TaxID=1005944 RepID=A0A1H0CT67_9ACTN|nr:adenylate/guanylate cyclase domain-containing protein [Nocardioides szechwanensis]GEP33334.1 adenylate cyclase [Nocardioides szechwanensis]SDN61107.1 adenylate cyclase [Nocardioides szechwanensis]